MEALKLNDFSRRVAVQLFERFPEWRNYARAKDMEPVINSILDIFSEKIVAVSWWAGEQFRGGTLGNSDYVPEASEHMHPFDRVRIRSWNGTFDQDIGS